MTETKRARTIIVGVDGSAGSIEALRSVKGLSEALHAPVVVASWQWPSMPRARGSFRGGHVTIATSGLDPI